MIRRHIRTKALWGPLALAALVALMLPASAAANDTALAQTIQVDVSLDSHVQTALGNALGNASPAALQSIAQTALTLNSAFARTMKSQRPSSTKGRRAKHLMMKWLSQERAGYKMIAKGLSMPNSKSGKKLFTKGVNQITSGSTPTERKAAALLPVKTARKHGLAKSAFGPSLGTVIGFTTVSGGSTSPLSQIVPPLGLVSPGGVLSCRTESRYMSPGTYGQQLFAWVIVDWPLNVKPPAQMTWTRNGKPTSFVHSPIGLAAAKPSRGRVDFSYVGITLKKGSKNGRYHFELDLGGVSVAQASVTVQGC